MWPRRFETDFIIYMHGIIYLFVYFRFVKALSDKVIYRYINVPYLTLNSTESKKV